MSCSDRHRVAMTLSLAYQCSFQREFSVCGLRYTRALRCHIPMYAICSNAFHGMEPGALQRLLQDTIEFAANIHSTGQSESPSRPPRHCNRCFVAKCSTVCGASSVNVCSRGRPALPSTPPAPQPQAMLCSQMHCSVQQRTAGVA